jgi:hypothetical protein
MEPTMPIPRGLSPLAFVYDRHVTPSRASLDIRLDTCRGYAAERRWQIVGEWLDTGDFALSDHRRLQLDELARHLADTARTAVCLIYDWTRLAHQAMPLATMRHTIALAGGWTECTTGENDLLVEDGRGARPSLPYPAELRPGLPRRRRPTRSRPCHDGDAPLGAVGAARTAPRPRPRLSPAAGADPCPGPGVTYAFRRNAADR